MKKISKIISQIKKYNPQADEDFIRRAYKFAQSVHLDQYRESGEDFILHPLDVAEILADLELDTTTIVAGFLHDVVEDTEVTLDQVEKEFGEEVAGLIDGVTKLSQIEFSSQEEEQAENLRKMLLAVTKDIRVIMIKLADRLHNMRTLRHLPVEKQRLKARETLEIYAPIAHRLGMTQLKWDLEDLAFSILEPKKYDKIRKMVAEQREEREAYLDEVVKNLTKKLGSVGVKAKISGRPKHFYSIYQKMAQKGVEFNEIYDLSAVRVLVDTVKECYAVLGTVHSLWKPVPGRFRDYVAMPKFNMYQSLHTTVIGPKGRPLEIQIRTPQMHQTAEYGIAAHWLYKEGREPDEVDARLAWFRQMMEYQHELKDPREFMEALKIDLFEDEVFVFTPKGDVITLPAGSTPLDFAYAIHTDVGHQCVGGKANDRIVPLEYKLQMGDRVEILTSKSATGPSKDWLSIVKTSRARNKIRQWFSRESREDSEQVGREKLGKVLRRHGLNLQVALRDQLLDTIAEKLNFGGAEELLANIGSGKTSAKQVATKIINALTEQQMAEAEEEKFEVRTGEQTRVGMGVKVEGVEGVLVRLAHCCNPVPPDEILGFVTHGRGVSIHRQDCPNAKQLLSQPDRLIEVKWDVTRPASFQVEIQVEALDRTKLLRDISTVISDAGVNILSANVTTTKDHLAIFRFIFEISNLGHLQNILDNIKRVDSVFDAHRVYPARSAKKSESNRPEVV